MKGLLNQRGFIKPIICLLILAFLIYAGFQFGIPYYRYSAFKDEVKELTRVGLGNTEKIKTDVYEAAKALKIPIEREDIEVTKRGETIRVQTSWSVNVDILGLYQREINFNINIEE